MSDPELMVFGFQSSGKTTFAAALWYLVDTKEVSGTALVRGKHTGDYRYLETIAREWAEGWALERTKHEEWRPISVNLRRVDPEAAVNLTFVDLSGETFGRMFALRGVDERVEPLLEKAEGLMVFVSTLHSHAEDKASLIDIGIGLPAYAPTAAANDDGEPEPAPAPNEAPAGEAASSPGPAQDAASTTAAADPASQAAQPARPQAKPFKPDMAGQQIQLVDLLDALMDRPVAMRPSKIAVIVSAWDKETKGKKRTPEAWLAASMPLLSQYLETNADRFESRVYGVSAQGGHVPKRKSDKHEPAEDELKSRDTLLKNQRASHRISVVGHGAGEHDLTHPIAWLSGLGS